MERSGKSTAYYKALLTERRAQFKGQIEGVGEVGNKNVKKNKEKQKLKKISKFLGPENIPIKLNI